MDDTYNPSGNPWDAAGVEKFTLRDLFRATRLAIGPTKWLTALFPVVLALAIPAVVKYLLERSGVQSGATSLKVVSIVGCILLYYGWVFSVSGVSYLVRGELLDPADRSFDDVLAFWRRHKWTLFWPPLMLLVLVGLLLALPFLFGLGGGVLTWIGNAPDQPIDFLVGLGGALWSLSLVIGIPLGILAAVFLLVLVLGSFVYPAIVAIKEDEHFDVAHDMIQVVFESGPKLVLTLLMTLGFMIVSAIVVWTGTNTALCMGHLCLGDEMLNMLASTPSATKLFTNWITDVNSVLPQNSIVYSILGVTTLPKWPGPAGGVVPADFSGGLLGIVLFLVSVGFIAYLIALFSASATLSYLTLADPLEIEDVLQRAREGGSADPFAPPAAAEADVPEVPAKPPAEAPAPKTPPAAPLAPPAAEKKRSTSKKATSKKTSTKKTTKKSGKKATKKSAKKKASKKKKKT